MFNNCPGCEGGPDFLLALWHNFCLLLFHTGGWFSPYPLLLFWEGYGCRCYNLFGRYPYLVNCTLDFSSSFNGGGDPGARPENFCLYFLLVVSKMINFPSVSL